MEQSPDSILANLSLGKVSAFNQVYNQLHKTIFFLAVRITKDEEAAKDILSESFMKLWQRRQQFETMENVKAFLYTITRNASIDYLRQKKQDNDGRKELTHRKDDNKLAAFADMETLRADLLQKLYEEIESLPPKCGEIFKLFFFEAKKTEQIAQQLNINKKTVLNQKARAILLLRTALLKKGLLQTILLHGLLCLGIYQG